MIRRLIYSLVISIGILFIEYYGSIQSHSVALLSDAGHIASDTMAHAISIIAILLSRKSSSNRFPMGMRKAESLASLLNGILLFLMSIWILHEAFERLESKENINPIAMLGYSATGLVANLMSLGLLHKHSKENMNVRSTYLHAMGDLLGTLGVVLGSVLIYFFQVQWIDIAVSMLICGFILKSSIQIILDSYVIINDGNLDIQASNELIQKIKDLGHLPFEIKILSKIHSHKKLILIWTNHFHEEDILHWEKKILEIDSQLELEHRYLSPQSTQNHESVFHTHHHHHH